MSGHRTARQAERAGRGCANSSWRRLGRDARRWRAMPANGNRGARRARTGWRLSSRSRSPKSSKPFLRGTTEMQMSFKTNFYFKALARNVILAEATRTPRKWTEEDDRLLLALRKAGKLVTRIAAELKRTEQATLQTVGSVYAGASLGSSAILSKDSQACTTGIRGWLRELEGCAGAATGWRPRERLSAARRGESR